MRWQKGQGSRNIEDRRGSGGGMSGRTVGGLGIGGIIVVIIAILFGGDPAALLQNMQDGGSGAPSQSVPTGAQPDDELGQFISATLLYTEEVFTDIFRTQLGKEYQPPVLVLFSGSTQSGCGFAQAATGPFYCPADQKVYIDLTFYNDLKNRFGAPGDFAMAYVLAHEVGHHVQNLLGISRQVSSQRGRVSQSEYNQLSVRLELQADFLAGVWANKADKMRNILEEGDIEEALRAANAIGDDRLQKQSQGRVVPDSFTHGTSEQRMRWFRKGYETGDLSQGDTFNARSL